MNTPHTWSRNVAVIEDDAAMLSGLIRMLSASGYVAEAFASAEQFLASSAEPAVACLVVDINLPGMSGIELCRHLAAHGRHIPSVIITARDDAATLREAADVGYAACLHKPFVGRALIDAIERAGSFDDGTKRHLR